MSPICAPSHENHTILYGTYAPMLDTVLSDQSVTRHAAFAKAGGAFPRLKMGAPCI